MIAFFFFPSLPLCFHLCIISPRRGTFSRDARAVTHVAGYGMKNYDPLNANWGTRRPIEYSTRRFFDVHPLSSTISLFLRFFFFIRPGSLFFFLLFFFARDAYFVAALKRKTPPSANEETWMPMKHSTRHVLTSWRPLSFLSRSRPSFFPTLEKHHHRPAAQPDLRLSLFPLPPNAPCGSPTLRLPRTSTTRSPVTAASTRSDSDPTPGA